MVSREIQINQTILQKVKIDKIFGMIQNKGQMKILSYGQCYGLAELINLAQ